MTPKDRRPEPNEVWERSVKTGEVVLSNRMKKLGKEKAPIFFSEETESFREWLRKQG